MQTIIANTEALKPDVWSYLFNSTNKVKNKHYIRMTIEIKPQNIQKGKARLGEEEYITVNVGGGVVKDRQTALIGTTEIPLMIYDKSVMKKQGWTPILNSNRKQVLAWIKPPYLTFCLDFGGIDLSNNVKKVVDKMLSYIQTMPKVTIEVKMGWVCKRLRDLIDKGKKEEIKRLEENAKNYDREVRRLSSDLANCMSKVRGINEKLEALNQFHKRKIDIKQIIKNTLLIEGVKKLTIMDGLITVITHPLKAKYKKRTSSRGGLAKEFTEIDIGAFRITWGDGSKIEIHNLWRHPSYGKDHPHVSSGNPCWGNMEEIMGLAQEFKIDVVVQLILSYLTNIHNAHTYEEPEKWAKIYQMPKAR